MKMRKALVCMVGLALALSVVACSKAPCPTCYEDAWSREPFPGQSKQHIPTPDVKGGVTPVN